MELGVGILFCDSLCWLLEDIVLIREYIIVVLVLIEDGCDDGFDVFLTFLWCDESGVAGQPLLA